jgi:hypothetical protein
MRRVRATTAAVEKQCVTYSESVSVAFGIQHAMHMRHIVICGLPCSTIFFHVISQTARFKEKRSPNIKCVYLFSLQLLSETFLILRRVWRDMIINVYRPSCKVAVILVRF